MSSTGKIGTAEFSDTYKSGYGKIIQSYTNRSYTDKLKNIMFLAKMQTK